MPDKMLAMISKHFKNIETRFFIDFFCVAKRIRRPKKSIDTNQSNKLRCHNLGVEPLINMCALKNGEFVSVGIHFPRYS